jgi:hypothetical protein
MLPPFGLALICRTNAATRLREEACSLPVLGGDGGSSIRLPGGVILGEGGALLIPSLVDMGERGDRCMLFVCLGKSTSTMLLVKRTAALEQSRRTSVIATDLLTTCHAAYRITLKYPTNATHNRLPLDREEVGGRKRKRRGHKTLGSTDLGAHCPGIKHSTPCPNHENASRIRPANLAQ